jgi:hypothetical protein
MRKSGVFLMVIVEQKLYRKSAALRKKWKNG